MQIGLRPEAGELARFVEDQVCDGFPRYGATAAGQRLVAVAAQQGPDLRPNRSLSENSLACIRLVRSRTRISSERIFFRSSTPRAGCAASPLVTLSRKSSESTEISGR